jgi:NAD(P)-dependent dehydrogenase (short-subunit alcohol dehydrogenase family)
MSTMDRVWFITGASSGFGRALAEAVVRRGERAVVAARRGAALAELVAIDSNRVMALPLDVTEAEARKAAVAAALARFGRIENFFAAAELCREVLPHMRARGAGHILNLTSIGGLISIGGFGAYCASKFALEAWSDALADEVVPLGIKITLVEPGNFRTEFAGDANVRPATQLETYRPVIAPIEEFLAKMAVNPVIRPGLLTL